MTSMEYEFDYLHEIYDADPILLTISMLVNFDEDLHPANESVTIWHVSKRGIIDIQDETGKSRLEYNAIYEKILAHFDEYEVNKALETYTDGA